MTRPLFTICHTLPWPSFTLDVHLLGALGAWGPLHIMMLFTNHSCPLAAISAIGPSASYNYSTHYYRWNLRFITTLVSLAKICLGPSKHLLICVQETWGYRSFRFKLYCPFCSSCFPSRACIAISIVSYGEDGIIVSIFGISFTVLC